jgi:hypothetical protein
MPFGGRQGPLGMTPKDERAVVLAVSRVRRIDTVKSPQDLSLAHRPDLRALWAANWFRAQQFIGLVYGEGSFYLLSKAAPNDYTAARQPWMAEVEQITSVLEAEGVPEPRAFSRLKDILIGTSPEGQRVFTVLDFETLPYVWASEENETADDSTILREPFWSLAAYATGAMLQIPGVAEIVDPLETLQVMQAALYCKMFHRSSFCRAWAFT